MADQSLPTKLHFIETKLHVVSSCDICHEPFSETHTPTRFRGTKDCQHIFGNTCIAKWFQSGAAQSNACPMCREVLFKKPRKATYLAGSDPGDNRTVWLDGLKTRKEAERFVAELWDSLGALYNLGEEEFFESAIDYRINLSLWAIVARGGTWCAWFGLYIKAEHWPGVRGVAKSMLDTHFDNGEYFRADTEYLNPWLLKLTEVLGWVLEESESEGDIQGEEAGRDHGDAEGEDDTISDGGSGSQFSTQGSPLRNAAAVENLSEDEMDMPPPAYDEADEDFYDFNVDSIDILYPATEPADTLPDVSSP